MKGDLEPAAVTHDVYDQAEPYWNVRKQLTAYPKGFIPE